MKEKPPVRQRCKVYCHTVGTKYDWQSSQLAKELIENIASGFKQQVSTWHPLVASAMQAFQPE